VRAGQPTSARPADDQDGTAVEPAEHVSVALPISIDGLPATPPVTN
jgi:hypothetical protein